MIVRALIVAAVSLATAALAQAQTGQAGHGAHAGQMASPSQGVMAAGTLKAVDPAKRVVNLSHEPIAAIGWPAMTMDFPVAPDVDLSTLKAGQAVEFTLVPGAGNSYTVARIKPRS